MHAFPAELALMNLLGRVAPDDPEFVSTDVAWALLREEIALGLAPPELGTDLAAWASWVDHTYARQRREVDGTATYRFLAIVTAEGKASSPIDQAFARVTLEVRPGDASQIVALDSSICTFAASPLPISERQAIVFAAIEAALHDYASRHRLVGLAISLLEIQIHPLDCDVQLAAVAACRALDEAIRRDPSQVVS
jgi:hypothetical protein